VVLVLRIRKIDRHPISIFYLTLIEFFDELFDFQKSEPANSKKIGPN
jgi:hypothetical protein